MASGGRRDVYRIAMWVEHIALCQRKRTKITVISTMDDDSKGEWAPMRFIAYNTSAICRFELKYSWLKLEAFQIHLMGHVQPPAMLPIEKEIIFCDQIVYPSLCYVCVFTARHARPSVWENCWKFILIILILRRSGVSGYMGLICMLQSLSHTHFLSDIPEID